MRKVTKLSQIVELTSSSCLLVLASYAVVFAQNGITIKFGYKYKVQDKLHNGLCTNPFIGYRDTSSLIRTWTTPTNCYGRKNFATREMVNAVTWVPLNQF